METIVSRIRQIARDIGIGEGNFEKSVKQSVGYLNITEKRKGNPSVDFILRITKKYPEYSLKWIFTGEGQMKLPTQNQVSEPNETYKNRNFEAEVLIKFEEVLSSIDTNFKALDKKLEKLKK